MRSITDNIGRADQHGKINRKSTQMDANMLIRRIKPEGLLSFGPDTQALELGPLNVLIGPNGSGPISTSMHTVAVRY